MTSPSSYTGLGMCVYRLSVFSMPKALHIIIIITTTTTIIFFFVHAVSQQPGDMANNNNTVAFNLLLYYPNSAKVNYKISRK